MIAVHLHGALARQYGKVWNLNIASVQEAVHAIDCMKGGFRAAILALEKAGMVFRVRTSKDDLDNDTVAMPLAGVTRVDIIPVVRGASAGLRFVVGAVLVVASGVLTAASFGSLSPVSAMMASVGVSLMIGSVIEWLTPVPKTNRSENGGGAQSWSISGPTNTVDQGLPVPIAYGEVLAGAYTVSAGVSVASTSPAGSVAPTAMIGGEPNEVFAFSPGQTRVLVLRFGVGSLAIAEPYTYTWTLGTFTGTYVSLNLVDANKGSCLLEVTATAGALGTRNTVTGTLNVTVAGKEVNPVNGAAPGNVSANASIPVRITYIGA